MPRSSRSLFFKGVSTDGKQDITRITCTYWTCIGFLIHLRTWNIFDCAGVLSLVHLSCFSLFFFVFFICLAFYFKNPVIKTVQSQSELWETKVVSFFTTELSELDSGKGNEGSLKAIIKSEQKQLKSDTLPPFKPPLLIKLKVLQCFPPILIQIPSSPGDTISMSLENFI